MRGRKFSSDDLQLMLLGLLEQGPSHGYELIKALEARSNGFYAPSPGMVYPALAHLEDTDRATVEPDGAKKRYRLAPAGLAWLDANRDRLALIWGELFHVSRKMEWVRRAWSGQPPELGPDGADVATGWLPEYVQARQQLKRALLRRADADLDEQRRIAAILARAAADIDGESCT